MRICLLPVIVQNRKAISLKRKNCCKLRKDYKKCKFIREIYKSKIMMKLINLILDIDLE